MPAFQAGDVGSILTTRTRLNLDLRVKPKIFTLTIRVMKVPETNTVVIPDLHGRVEKLEDALDHYGEDIRYVLLGDLVDGPEVKNTLDIVNFMIIELGAVAIKGKHEWVLDAALNSTDEEERRAFRHQLWRRCDSGRFKGYEDGTLASYKIEDSTPTDKAAMILRNRMTTTGHLALLREMPLFIEAPDFIAVHAGLTNEPWLDQRETLESEEKQLMTDTPSFAAEPDQLFGFRVKNNDYSTHNQSIARSTEVLTDIGRTLVTGHAHLSLSAEQRTTDNGNRIRLASKLDEGEPLFVWQSWDNQVVAIE